MKNPHTVQRFAKTFSQLMPSAFKICIVLMVLAAMSLAGIPLIALVLTGIGMRLFAGYVDGATTFAENCGGGGGTSHDNDWGRDPKEDDIRWARLCFHRAHELVATPRERGGELLKMFLKLTTQIRRFFFTAFPLKQIRGTGCPSIYLSQLKRVTIPENFI